MIQQTSKVIFSPGVTEQALRLPRNSKLLLSCASLIIDIISTSVYFSDIAVQRRNTDGTEQRTAEPIHIKMQD